MWWPHSTHAHSPTCVYRPHWLVQWSRHCSRMRIPAPSSWLPGYMNPVPTNLVTLTVAGLFPDRPRIHTCFSPACSWVADRSGLALSCNFFSFSKRFYFLEREEERERHIDFREKHWSVASCMSPTGDLACNPGVCPGWESNQWPFGSQAVTQSTEPHQPRQILK